MQCGHSRRGTLKRSNVVFIVVLLAYVVYAGYFIYRTSFVIHGERHFSLFDDAMISMRYAKNLANGYGLTWNPNGERVEGYTNLLWVLYMSLFHLLPIAQSKMSLFIQISAAVFLSTSLLFIKKTAELISQGSAVLALSSVFLTAFYYPLNNWSLQGMEVSVLTLILTIAVWKASDCLRSARFSSSVYVLLGIGTLVRMDMAVPFAFILAFLAISDRENRNRHLLFGLGYLAIFMLSQMVFRLLCLSLTGL